MYLALVRFGPSLVLAVAGLTVLVLTAIIASPPTPSLVPTATVSPTPVAATATPSPSPASLPAAVLTGVEVTDLEVLQRPILAIKVENSPAARPQSGLDQADMVVEELVEGGITRFIVLVQSQLPPSIGPVRSGRLVDAEFLPPYGALLGASGARDDVLSAISRAGIQAVYDDGRGTTFTRDRSRNAPHNLYTTAEGLLARAVDRVKPAVPSGLTFGAVVPDGATRCQPVACPDAGTQMTLRMSNVAITGWAFDAPAGVYRRSQNGAPFLVTGDGRIGAANVVVLGMVVGPGGCCDASGSSFTATQVIGTGPAIVLRDGERYDVTWRKRSASDHVTLVRDDGSRLPLRPGPTWLHLAPVQNLPAAASDG